MQLRKLVSSVSEGGVTLEGLTVEVEHGVMLLTSDFRQPLLPSRSQSSDGSLSFYSSSVVPGCTGSQQTEDAFPRLYKFRLASNRHRQSTFYAKFRMDLVLR